MRIRFTCAACRTVMKLGEPITEQKKVRCSGCATVIVLTPDPTNPGDVIVTIPNRAARPPKAMSEAKRRNILMAIVAALIAFMAISVWQTSSSSPGLTAAVEGLVTLDGAPVAKGTIVYTPENTSKGAKEVTIAIVNGRYSARASSGPFMGMNRVQIFSDTTQVKIPDESINIQPGTNRRDYLTESK
jgi:hypothetical protein